MKIHLPVFLSIVCFSVFFCKKSEAQLSGTYTINVYSSTSGRNFQTFNDFINALNTQGISGAVVANVANGSGPYNEQVILEPFSGMSSTNTVTINGNGEVLTYSTIGIADHRVVGFNDSAQYFILDNIKITTNNGIGVAFSDYANNNIVKNCTIEIRSPASSYKGYGVAFSDCKQSIFSCNYPSNASNNVIENNVIKGLNNGGSEFGIYLNSSNSSGLASNNVIRNNTITGFLKIGIYSVGQNNLSISNNDISRPIRSTPIATIGISIDHYGKDSLSNLVIDGNKIHDLHGGELLRTSYPATGISINAQFSSSQPARIFNNAIYSFNNSSSDIYGVRDHKSRNVKYYHNSISLDDKQAYKAAITVGIMIEQEGDSAFIKNNIVSISRGGGGDKTAIYFSDTNIFVDCNHNNLYLNSGSGNEHLVHFGQSFATLADWQNSLLFNAGLNSFSVEPHFKAYDDLTPRNSLINNKGAALGLDHDINQKLRDSIPDLGAIEVECMNPSPVSFIPLSDSSMHIVTGLDSNFNGSWEIEYDLVNFNPGLAANKLKVYNNVDTVISGFSFNTKYYASVRSFCTSSDTSLWSDNYEFETTGVPLAGVYSIDSSQITAGRNFQSFVDFADRLQISGVSDSVLANVVVGSGPYEQQVIFLTIPGSSKSNYVRINGNNETLQYEPDNTDQRIIGFETVENFIIDSLNIVGLDDEYGFGIHFRKECNNIKIRYCNIDLSAITNASFRNAIGIIANHSIVNTAPNSTAPITVSNLVIKENTFFGTTNGGPYSAIVLRSSPSSYGTNNKIVGNRIFTLFDSGIAAFNQDSLLIKGNKISNPNRLSSISTQRGIYIDGPDSKYIKVEANEIFELLNISSDFVESRGIEIGTINASKEDSILIFNNLIYNLGDVNSYGLYNHGGKNLFFFNNTIAFNDTSHTEGVAIGILQKSTDTIRVFNNNISITKKGTEEKIGVKFLNGVNTAISDFNNVHVDTSISTNTLFANYRDNNYNFHLFKTLSEWQNATGHDDVSVSVNPLFSIDFRPANRTLSSAAKNLSLSTDFNGDARDSTPDIGAINLEKLNYPYYPIDIVNSSDQSSGIADSLGVYCKTSGIVLSIDLKGGKGLQFYIFDKTSDQGIAVYSDQSISNYQVKEGDSVLVIGQIKQRYGQTSIEPIDLITLKGSIQLPEAKLVQSMGETVESSLIKLQNLKLLVASDSLDYLLTALDQNNDTVKVWIDADTDVNDRLNSKGLTVGDSICTIIGICNQLDSVAPFKEGYRLTPVHFSQVDTINCVVTDFNFAKKDTLHFTLENCKDSVFFKSSISNYISKDIEWCTVKPSDSIYESFDGKLQLFWRNYKGAVLDTSCGSINNSLAITFKGKKGSRFLESHPLNLGCADQINISVLKNGNCGSNFIDSNQFLRLQYSTDFGVSWQSFYTFDTTGNYNIAIPTTAKKELIKLRLVQLNSSSDSSEIWIVDDFRIYPDSACADILKLFADNGVVGENTTYDFSGYFYNSGFVKGITNFTIPIYLMDTLRRSRYLTLSLNYDNDVCADFSFQNLSCGGTFNFYNHSLGSNLAYQWSFGDGDSSFAENPRHFYEKAGIYKVKLMACDSSSCSSISKQIIVASDYGPKEPACSPTLIGSTSNMQTYYISIGNDTLFYGSGSNTLGSGHASHDHTCEVRLQLKKLRTYPIRIVNTGLGQYKYIRNHMWIDYNNDGFFALNERIVASNNGTGAFVNVQIPDTAVTDIPLRMRMTAFIGIDNYPPNLLLDCNSPIPMNRFQRDYTVIITDTLLPPVASFTDSVLNCGYQVAFSSESEHFPDSYLWDFGDGNTSVAANAIHTYDKPGTYNVKLIVENQFGIDSVSRNITIQSKLVPIINGKLIPYCEMDFGIQNSSGFMNIHWDFGNGRYATGINASNAYSQGGSYLLTVQAIDSSNCKVEYQDSLDILYLVDTVVACDSFKWINGITYTSSSDTATYVFATDPNGCDSIVSLDLTINRSSESSDTVNTCRPYKWPFNGQTYYNSGTYRDTLSTGFSCDSIGELHLVVTTIDTTVSQNLSTLLSNEVGGSYQWLDCNNGYSILPNDTNRSYSTTYNGSFAVEVTKNNCVDTSSCIAVHNVGLNEISGKNGIIKLFPNPTNNYINVVFESKVKDVKLEVIDIMGKSIYTNYTDSKENRIDIKGADGIYFLKVSTKNNIQTFKFTKIGNKH